LLDGAGLESEIVGSYGLPMELEALLARSAAPDPDVVRALYERAIEADAPLGIGERRDGNAVHFEFPIAVLIGRVPSD
jgi:hypothetical protein